MLNKVNLIKVIDSYLQHYFDFSNKITVDNFFIINFNYLSSNQSTLNERIKILARKEKTRRELT